MLDRRRFLLSTAGLAALAALPACSGSPQESAPSAAARAGRVVEVGEDDANALYIDSVLTAEPDARYLERTVAAALLWPPQRRCAAAAGPAAG